MKNLYLLLIFLPISFIGISCNNLGQNSQSSHANDEQVASGSDNQEFGGLLYFQDSIFLDRLKNSLSNTFEDTTLKIDSSALNNQQNDYWNVLNDSSLVKNWIYTFTNKNDTGQVVILNLFLMKDCEPIETIIDQYCDNERLAELKGGKQNSIKWLTDRRLPHKTFKYGNLFCVLNSSPSAQSTLDKVYIEFRENKMILNEDVIPSERKYIAEDIKKKIEPVLKKWLLFYNLDLNLFYGGIDSNQDDVFMRDASTDTLSVYYNDFGEEYNVYTPIWYDYSPDRNNFLTVRASAGVYQDDKDGKYYYQGGDDSANILLIQRQKKRVGIVLSNGVGTFTEAAFWIDNDNFILVSHISISSPEMQIRIYGKINATYSYRNAKHKVRYEQSYFEQDLKSRGIIID